MGNWYSNCGSIWEANQGTIEPPEVRRNRQPLFAAHVAETRKPQDNFSPELVGGSLAGAAGMVGPLGES